MFNRNPESDPQTSNRGKKNRKRPSGSCGATLLLMEEEGGGGERRGRRKGERQDKGQKGETDRHIRHACHESRFDPHPHPPPTFVQTVLCSRKVSVCSGAVCSTVGQLSVTSPRTI